MDELSNGTVSPSVILLLDVEEIVGLQRNGSCVSNSQKQGRMLPGETACSFCLTTSPARLPCVCSGALDVAGSGGPEHGVTAIGETVAAPEDAGAFT